jgi:hypothetical protein
MTVAGRLPGPAHVSGEALARVLATSVPKQLTSRYQIFGFVNLCQL